VVEAAVTGDPVGDVVTRYGPVIDDDPEGLAANAEPASTRAETAVRANAILVNTEFSFRCGSEQVRTKRVE